MTVSADTQNPQRSGRLKLLVLTPFAPRLDAADGGGRVTANLIAQLADRHDTALLYLRAPEEPPLDPALQVRCRRVDELLLARRRDDRRRRLHTWRSVIGGKPLWAIDRSTIEGGPHLRRLVEVWRPDIVQVEYHIMGQYLPALAGYPAPRVLTQHEPGTAVARELWHSGHVTGRLMPYLNWWAWRRFERAIMRQVQTVVVFTERDRRETARLAGDVPIVQIPLGIGVPNTPLDPVGQGPPTLLFVGNFQHLPNVDAALRLTDQIFPRVHARFPEAQLYLVGSHPPPAVQQRASERVVVTDYVPDLAPYLNQAAVVTVPLRLGGGMRVKVLEALAAGKAVVATARAVEGLNLSDQLVVAESDEAFSEAVCSLLESAPRRAALARQARDWACLHLGWETYADAYEGLYRHLLAAKDPLG
jgi:polysaccharide biosynthesis protein PslH